MINAEILKQKIQTRIENESRARQQGYHFIFFTDTDEYKHDQRVKNRVDEYINGLFSIESSDVQNLTNGMVFATQSAVLEIIFRMPDREYDLKDEQGRITVQGWRTKINNIRAILDTVCQRNTTEVMEDSNRNKFYVSTIASFADSGTRSQEANLGDCFTFKINLYYMFVENGINTTSREIQIDDTYLPVQTYTETNIRTEDSNVYADSLNGTTKSIQLQQTWGLTVEFPYVDNQFLKSMLKEIQAGELNFVHMLLLGELGNYANYANGKRQDGKLVYVSQIVVNGDTNKNLGGKITFTEAIDNYELISGFAERITVCEVEQVPVMYDRHVIGSDDYNFYFFSTKEFYHINYKTYPKNADGDYVLNDLPFKVGDIVLVNSYNLVGFIGLKELGS